MIVENLLLSLLKDGHCWLSKSGYCGCRAKPRQPKNQENCIFESTKRTQSSNMRIRNILLLTLFLVAHHLYAQDNDTVQYSKNYSIQAGYYAPYGNQYGGRIAFSYPYKHWTQTTAKGKTRIHSLDITPRFGFFAQPRIQQNYVFDVTLEYKWYQPTRKIHPRIGIGLGYLLARQNVGGSVNLANGDIEFEKRSLNFFVPTINIGFERNRNKRIGYYFSTFFGRKLTGQEVNSAIVGAELGITYNFQNL